MRLALHLAATTLLLLVDCSKRPDALPNASAESGTPAAVADALRAAGLELKSAGTLQQPFFSVPAQVFTVDGSDLQIYAFGSASEAENAAKKVASDGGSIGTTAMAWMAPPHFFRQDRLVAIYIGSSAKTLAELQRILGPQFAGRT